MIQSQFSDRLILQSDWETVLRERDGKAWVSYKTAVPPSVWSELNGQGVSSDGRPYITAKDEEFNVSNITKNSVVITYNGEQASLTQKFVCPLLSFCSIHPSRKRVTCLDTAQGGLGVSCDSEGKLRVWQTDTGEVRRELEGHVGDVYTCRFFPSGIVVMSAGADMMLKIWSAENGQCAATMTGHKAAILDTAIVERGRNVVTTSRDGTAKLWDVGQQTCLATFEEIGGDVNSCALGVPENSVFLGASSASTNDREVGVEGKMLLLGCENGTLQGYGLHTREQIFNFTCESAVNTCSFTSEIHVVCGTQDGHVFALDMRNTSTPLVNRKESRGPIWDMFAHKGGFFTSTGDGSCFYVDENHQTRCELTGSDCDPVYKIACDGTKIYTSCRDGVIRKYSLSFI